MQIPETEIIVTKDGAEILRKTVRPGDYVIGREEGCDVQVEVALVSRRHAQLTVNYDHALIEDLGSSNGTRVNGKPVTESTRLWPNQKIQIGEATVVLRRLATIAPPDVSLAPATAAVKRLLPEEILNEQKYDIGGIVAQGGMGAILNAQEASIQRPVAMKVMLDGSSPDDLTRFVAEARVTGQLEHPNIVPVHELGVNENDQIFYTMKLVRGITLRKVLDLMADGNKGTIAKYPLAVLLTIFQKVCDAIAFAHSKGVIHRDLKPDNIMLDDFGVVLVMDWGLAKRLNDQGVATAGERMANPMGDLSRSGADISESTATYATMAGAIMGTPQYMAPEQARGEVETLDARADVYALGAILYHILALRPSVNGEPWEIVDKVAQGQIEPLVAAGSERRSSPGTVKSGTAGISSSIADSARKPLLQHLPGARIPDSLAAVVRKAMALHKEQRYAGVADLQCDLTAYQNGFATGAENARLMKQIILLIKRNKGIFITGFAAWLLITAVAGWFVIHLRESERETRRQADIAKQNEALAVQEKEAARRALANSALALAEAARRESNGAEMQAALKDVPEDLRDSTWHYLLDQSDTSIARVHINANMIYSVAADPRRPGVFAFAGNNGKITLMLVRIGTRLLEFPIAFPPKTPGSEYRIAFSPDGERIAVGRGGAGGIVIHSAKDGTKLAEWEGPPLRRVEFSGDGKLLLGISVDESTLAVWNATTGELRWKYEPEGRSAGGTFTPDGQQVVTYGSLDHLRLVSAKDGSLVRPIGAGVVTTFAVRPDGKALIYGRNDGRVKSIELKDDKLIFDFRPHDQPIWHLAFTPDGTRFVTEIFLPDGRQDIQLWDAFSGALQQTLLGGAGSMWDMGVHPLSGELLVAGPTSRVWNLNSVPEKWTLKGGAGDGGVAFWGSDDLVFAPGSGTQCGLQKLQAGTPALLWKPTDNAYHRLNVSADGRFAAIGRTLSDAAVFVLRNPGAHTEEAATFKPVGGGGVDILRLSPTGDRLAIIQSYSHKLNLYDPATGAQPLMLASKNLRSVRDIGWLGNKRQLVGLATAKSDRGNPGSEEWVVLWDASTGKVLQNVVNRTAMDVLAVSPDGSRFAEAGADKLVRIRDAGTLAVQHEFRAHDGPITALAWHPTKAILATASTDLSVKLWDIETGRRLEELRGPLLPPSALAFSPRGGRLASSGGDPVTRIWEPHSLNDQPAAKQDTGGWEDLMAPLTPALVAKTGNGWHLENGALFSPNGGHSALPLPSNLRDVSYRLRIKLRELTAKESFDLVLPIGNSMVLFVVDGWPTFGGFTALNLVNKKEGKILPQAVRGRVIRDAEEHEVEVTVRLDGENVTFTSTLDGQPLHEWTGPTAALSLSSGWICPPGAVALGSMSSDWVVYEVKLKRLEK